MDSISIYLSWILGGGKVLLQMSRDVSGWIEVVRYVVVKWGCLRMHSLFHVLIEEVPAVYARREGMTKSFRKVQITNECIFTSTDHNPDTKVDAGYEILALSLGSLF